MKKIFCVLALICIFAVSLVGCKSESQYNNSLILSVQAYDTSVVQSFSISANTNYYRTQGATENEINDYIKGLESTVKQNIWNNLYLNLYATYLSNPNQIYVLGGDYVEIKKPQYNSISDAVIFSFSFKSYDAWRYYHSSDKDSGNEENKDESIFIETERSNGVFPFSQNSLENTVGEIYAQIINETKLNYFDNEIVKNEDEYNFVYDYATTHKRVHSNADYIYQDTLYHHIWVAEYQQLKTQKEIQIYTVSAVQEMWYIVTLAVAVGVAGVGIVTIVLYERLKKSKKKNAQNTK